MISMKDRFNEITYTQEVYRVLLDCMARPGKIGQISPANCGLNISFSDYILGVAITLLDHEVTFHIFDHIFENISDSSEQLQMYTRSRLEKIENCDYLIIDGEKIFDIHCLKKGSLKFPDESTAVICQVKELLSEPRSGAISGAIKIELQGPGIQGRQTLYVDGLNKEMMEPWQHCNREFPLGLDWILVDLTGRLSCIPRSTRFVWEVI